MKTLELGIAVKIPEARGIATDSPARRGTPKNKATMINYKPHTVKKRSNQYHTKLVYWEDKPGMEKTEMQAHIFGSTPEEVEEKVAQFKKSQEKL